MSPSAGDVKDRRGAQPESKCLDKKRKGTEADIASRLGPRSFSRSEGVGFLPRSDGGLRLARIVLLPVWTHVLD